MWRTIRRGEDCVRHLTGFIRRLAGFIRRLTSNPSLDEQSVA
ncbi:hypothetical protein ABH966_003805 [Lysinibacillus sp. RC46]